MFIKLDCYTFADRMAEDFSREAAEALFDHLEELESDCGDPQEFDRIAIRCDFSEYPSATAAARGYGWNPEADEESALAWLQDRTSVIEFDGGVIIQNF